MTAERRTRFSRKWPWWGLAGAMLASAAVAWWWIEGDAGSDGPARATAEVQRGDIEDLVTATGTLQPRNYVDVGAQISGQLLRMPVEVGDEVEKGDLLAEIDATIAQARVDASRAELRQLRAQLAERRAQLGLAELTAERERRMLAEDATSLESVQVAEADLEVARAQIDSLTAQIDQRQSSLRADEANLEYSRIEAPMSGTVVSITAREGQTLNVNQQAPIILRIADLSTMTVQTQVSEADIGRLRVGMPAYFTTLGDPNHRWQGRLARIEPTPEILNNVVLYNAPFDVENENGRLMTEMTAQVFFVAESAEDALLVPIAAIAFPAGADAEGRGVVEVLQPDGSVVRREVTVGVTNRVQAQVLEGLDAGETVMLGAARAALAADESRGPRFGPGLGR